MAKVLKINKALTLVYFNNLILGELRINGINGWVAGGTLRDYFSEKKLNSDCDIFFPNINEFNKAKNYFISRGAKIIWESDNGMKVTYNGKTFDLIKIFMPNPKETISRFDFTISMFATDGKEIYLGKNSLKDLQDSKLVINTVVNPLSTLKRVLKHYKKGFTMSAEETKKLYYHLNNSPYNEADDLLSANGSSGENMQTIVTEDEKPVVYEEKYDVFVKKENDNKTKIIIISAFILGYLLSRK
jgi:hypothetical protein